MEAAGGFWALPHWIERWELMRQRPAMLAEARRRGIRALEVDRVDEDLLDALPGLEFLMDSGISPGPLIERFTRLRWLGVATWEDGLDLGRLQALEWLAVGECQPGNLDSLASGHASLRHLTAGKYPATDLEPLRRLRLERLSVGNSRRLTSLANPGSLAESLIGLELWMLPALGSLDGIEAFTNLQALTLARVPHVTTLEWVHHLPKLRLLDVGELKNVESLAPLAGHPSLEWVESGRTRDMDLSPLPSIPNLRLYGVAPGRWSGDVSGLPGGPGLSWRDPEYAEMLRFQAG
jgi:hypothetical protein